MPGKSRLLVLPLVLGMLVAMPILCSSTQAVARQSDEKLAFEVYKDKAGEYRWRLTSGGKVVAVPEDAYKNQSDVKSAIGSIQKNIAKMKVEYYLDKGKEHRWRVVATNGRVMARSSTSYKTKDAAEKAVGILKAAAAKATISYEKTPS